MASRWMMPDYDKGEKRARARFAFLSLSPFFSLRETRAERLLECEGRERARKRRRERQKQRGSVQAVLLLTRKVRAQFHRCSIFFFPFFFLAALLSISHFSPFRSSMFLLDG
jgi:hypothetical protein